MNAPVFDAWRGKPLDDALYECRELYEDAAFPTVRRWREAGGKVAGHFQVYFPEELAHAAGMLPVKVRGAAVDAMQAESRFGSYLCSIIKTSLELALSNRLPLDLFVSHPICDAARNLAAVWARNASYPAQIFYLPQNANSAYAASYLADEYRRVLADLEQIAGRKVSDDELRRSIEVFNCNRRLLRDLYDLKREAPWRVAADEAYVLVALAGLLPREEHNELLEWVLPRLAGGEQPAPLERVTQLLDAGAQIATAQGEPLAALEQALDFGRLPRGLGLRLAARLLGVRRRLDGFGQALRQSLALRGGNFGHASAPCSAIPRAEARTSFERILARLDRLELVDAGALSYAPTFIIRGLNALPVRFRARP